MRLSYVIVSYNRRETLLRTLQHLKDHTPLDRSQWEAWVVDNASTDGSADAVTQHHPDVHLIRNPRNEGMYGRNHAFAVARGQYIIIIDDDSYPIDDAVTRSIAYLDAHPRTAVVVGRVVLPSGATEAPALPSVLIGGASCIRKAVIDHVGGFPREFFRQAEEYDLSFRIWGAGYDIQRFEDIVYRHDKVPSNRPSSLIHRMDLRNNLILVERYLPTHLRKIYRDDWKQRYTAIARQHGHLRSAKRALWEARGWAVREACRGRRILSQETIESLFELDVQARAVAGWASRNHIRKVAIADFSKNIYATYRACNEAGLRVLAVADNGPAFEGQIYRGVRVLSDSLAITDNVDGVIISNINPAQAPKRSQALQQVFHGPILQLWEPRYVGDAPSAAAA